MMNYSKPVISVDSGLAEGVYMVSGASADGCYTVSASIHQTPETGRGDYRIKVDAKHNADHTRDAQTLTISFNQNVDFQSCNGNGASYKNGSGTNTLVIGLGYHQNPTDNFGFGDLVVTSDAGLAITSVSVTALIIFIL